MSGDFLDFNREFLGERGVRLKNERVVVDAIGWTRLGLYAGRM